MARALADPNSSRHGSETGHVFGQDSDPVGEFCSLNVVYHFVSETQKGAKFLSCVKGVLDPSTPPSGGQSRSAALGDPPRSLRKNNYFHAESRRRYAENAEKERVHYLTAIYAVADNNGLFLGVPGSSPLLNQFACPWLPQGTLAAEVFVA